MTSLNGFFHEPWIDSCVLIGCAHTKGHVGRYLLPQTLTQSLTPKTHVNSDWVRVCFARYRSPPLPQWKNNKQLNKIILARSISGRAAKSRRRFSQLRIANVKLSPSDQRGKLFTLKFHWIISQPQDLKSWLEQKTFKFRIKPISRVLFFFSEVFISLRWYGLTSMFLIHPEISTVWKCW